MKTKYYLDILNCIITGKSLSEGTVGNISLQELFWFARLNKMLPLISEYLDKWQPATQEEQNLVADWKTMAMQQVFGEHRKLHLVKQLLAEAEKRKIQLIFFKGYLLAGLYKNFALRNSSDTDIFVKEEALQEAVLMLKELQYRPVSELDTKNVYTFVYEENGAVVHKIELHTSLYDDAAGAELEQLNNLQLTAEEHIISVACCGMELKALNHTEHFLYQVVHMVKHFCCHGFPSRYLLDMVLFIRQYESEINWRKINEAVESLGYQEFYVQLISVLVHYFGLSESLLSREAIKPVQEAEELLRDIFSFGARSYGKKLSGAFFYFETYIEKMEQTLGKRLEQITFDGTMVPATVVPLQYQQEEQLQKRIGLLRKMKLI